MMEKARVTKATLGRLPRYLRLLKELPPNKTPYISATAIAKKLALGEVLVRKDLNSVSGAGRAKVGYEISNLIESLESVLGLNNYTSAVLVGAGRLGRALFEYDGFEDYGVKIVAAFDSDEQLIRLTQSKEILPMEMFETFCRAHHVQIGADAYTVDAASAADQAVAFCS